MNITKRCLQTLCLVLSSVSALAAATWHVAPAPEGDDNNSGAGWDSPFATVAKAVQTAATGDEVVVSNGVYTLTQQILVDKAITVRSLNGAEVTTLDGGPNNTTTRIFFINHPDAKVDGFTIKRGVGSAMTGYSNGVLSVGGGVLLDGGLLANCSVLTNNAADGAGVYFKGNSSVVSNCLVQGNTASNGGGGLGNTSQAGGRLYGNRVFRNQAEAAGGAGVLINDGYMENNIVAYNKRGGGVRQRGGINVNSLIYRNTSEAGDTGGGLFVSPMFIGGPAVVRNNTVVFNDGRGDSANANARTAGLRANQETGNETTSIINTIAFGNLYRANGSDMLLGVPGQATYSCWPTASGTGNITSDPAFVEAAADNFNLSALSPCVDVGLNQDWMTGATDVAGQDRIVNTTVDMGAYELQDNLGVAFTASVTSGFAPLEVVFTSVVVGNTSGLTYRWSFNDGGTTTDLQGSGLGTVTHVYGPGSFTAAVTVENANAEVATYVLPTTIAVGVLNTYAAPNGGNIAPFDSWAKAAQSIADALAYSSDGTTLTVSNGTYTVSQQLVVDKAVTVRSLNGAAVTTLDGGANNTTTRIFRINHANAVVDGFTIKRGYGSVQSGYGSGGHSVGGGVLMDSGLLMNSSVLTNSAAEGGGVFFAGPSSVVSNCLVQGNTATRYGAGLSNIGQASGGRLYGNKVLRNTGAIHGGGGVWLDYGHMENNTVAFNTHSGGIRQRGGTNRNSLVYRNTSESGSTGGGIYVSHGGLIENNTVAYNNGGTGGNDPLNRSAGLRANDFNDTSVIRNTIVWGNTFVGSEVLLPSLGSMTYSCWPAGTSGTGNISANPMFRNPAADDFSIPFQSPCVDTGLNQIWMATATDAAGMPRIFRSVVDMGALEDNIPASTIISIR